MTEAPADGPAPVAPGTVILRARFKLMEVRNYHWTRSQATTLRFEPVFDVELPREQCFTDFTPRGYLEMACNNRPAMAQLALGGEYYCELTATPGEVMP